MIYLTNGIRIIAIMVLLFVLSLLTGRRKMAELPVFDFLVILVDGSLVGAFVFEPEGRLLHTSFALVILILMQFIYSLVIIKNRKTGRLLTFEPVVVIENGQFVKANMSKLKFSLDNILSMLREKDVFDLEEVEYAVVEPSGKLSVLKKSQYKPVSAKELQLGTTYAGLSYPLIVEGKVYENNLRKLKLDRAWLVRQLNSKGVASEKDVFFASVNSQRTLYVSTGHPGNTDSPELRH